MQAARACWLGGCGHRSGLGLPTAPGKGSLPHRSLPTYARRARSPSRCRPSEELRVALGYTFPRVLIGMGWVAWLLTIYLAANSVKPVIELF